MIFIRGASLGRVGSRYGLKQVHVFRQNDVGVITLEVEDLERFGEIVDDPDFQVRPGAVGSVRSASNRHTIGRQRSLRLGRPRRSRSRRSHPPRPKAHKPSVCRSRAATVFLQDEVIQHGQRAEEDERYDSGRRSTDRNDHHRPQMGYLFTEGNAQMREAAGRKKRAPASPR